MERLIPLPEYEVFAYLMAGLAVMAAGDVIYGTRMFLRNEWSITGAAAVVIAAYVLGHALTWASSRIVESGIVGRLMRPPVAHLVTRDANKQPLQPVTGKPPSWLAALFSPYFVALEDHTQEMIWKKKPPGNRTELYWEAYNSAKQDEHAFDRMLTFHRLYDFCRNMAFASFLGAIAVAVEAIRRRERPPTLDFGFPEWAKRRRWQFIAFLALGFVLFSRFLYFYRAHAIEALTSYAYATPPA